MTDIETPKTKKPTRNRANAKLLTNRILDTLKRSREPLTAEEIYRKVADECAGVQTIYEWCRRYQTDGIIVRSGERGSYRYTTPEQAKVFATIDRAADKLEKLAIVATPEVTTPEVTTSIPIPRRVFNFSAELPDPELTPHQRTLLEVIQISEQIGYLTAMREAIVRSENSHAAP